jgi:hypothetical protein
MANTQEPHIPSTEKRTGRPVVLPRGEMAPLGRVLAERGISMRALGEAVAIAEKKPERVPTSKVSLWIWGKNQPTLWRQRLIAQLLKLPQEELFPPQPKRERPKRPKPRPDLQLLAAAAELEPEPEIEASALLARAVAQEQLPEALAGTPSMHYRALTARQLPARNRKPSPASTLRKAA